MIRGVPCTVDFLKDILMTHSISGPVSTRRHTSVKRSRRHRLAVEFLEERRLLAGDLGMVESGEEASPATIHLRLLNPSNACCPTQWFVTH